RKRGNHGTPQPRGNFVMKTKSLFAGLLVARGAAVLAGCNTADSRIARNRAAFEAWPPDVQEKVIHGQIAVGFTRDQVAVALGQPDRVFTRTTADGTTETWAYRDHGPRFSFGVGIGSFGRQSATSVGIGTSTGYRSDERLGVV